MITDAGARCIARAQGPQCRSKTPWNRGATRRRATTSGITRTALVTTIRCGAIPAMRRRPGSAVSWRCRVSCSRRAGSSPGYVGGIPGVHAMWAGADWTWHKPVLRNQAISTEAWLKDLIEHDTKFAGRAIQQIYHVNFFNPDGDLVAEADSWCFRTDRDQAREQGTKYSELRARPPRVYYGPRIWPASTTCMPPRKSAASTPRYWEDVSGRRHAADHGEGADDGHRLHRIRSGLGRALHSSQQAGVASDQHHPGLGITEPFRHPRLPGAGSLGAGVRADGRCAGGL